MEMSNEALDQILEKHQVRYQVHDSDLKRIPKKGPFILVFNRMWPGLDELLLIKIFGERFPNFKILTDHPLADEAGLESYFFKNSAFNINLVQKPGSFLETFIQVLQSSDEENWVLAIVLDFSNNSLESISKRPYIKRILKSVKNAGYPVVPVRLDLSDKKGRLQHFMHLKKVDWKHYTLRVGNVISIEDQEKVSERYWKYIRSKLFALGTGLEVKPFFQLSFFRTNDKHEALADPVDSVLIEEEIQNLTFENLITSQGEFDVLVAESRQIPNVLNEIGRLRELTFREVGEGTGKRKDLDEFDLYYLQLIIWDREAKRIAGGYRLGKGDEIFANLGIEGFYINSLFKIDEGFYPVIQQSIELGRSYIVPDYQRKRLPLFLLWRGILFFLLKNPHYKYLYGPLSISKYYSEVSKSLIVEFVKRYYFDHDLAKYLRPRKPFKVKTKKVDIGLLLQNIPPELNALDNFIEDIEPGHFRIPVLLKQYAKQNAKFISFNVDPNFSDVLDGFMILDLKSLPLSTIEALKQEQS
jgi:hypothetical protein